MSVTVEWTEAQTETAQGFEGTNTEIHDICEQMDLLPDEAEELTMWSRRLARGVVAV